MKKQWLLIVILAALLVVAVIFASRKFPDNNQTLTTGDSQTTESTGTGETFDATFPTVSYEEYQNMSGPDRQAYYQKFSSPEEFNAWLKAAREAYEAERATVPTIDGDGPIDIGGLIGGDEDE